MPCFLILNIIVYHVSGNKAPPLSSSSIFQHKWHSSFRLKPMSRWVITAMNSDMPARWTPQKKRLPTDSDSAMFETDEVDVKRLHKSCHLCALRQKHTHHVSHTSASSLHLTDTYISSFFSSSINDVINSVDLSALLMGLLYWSWHLLEVMGWIKGSVAESNSSAEWGDHFWGCSDVMWCFFFLKSHSSINTIYKYRWVWCCCFSLRPLYTMGASRINEMKMQKIGWLVLS